MYFCSGWRCKCLISQYRHFNPGGWEIPVNLAYNRAAVSYDFFFLLCFQTLRQEQTTDNGTKEVNVPLFNNFAKKKIGYIENTTLFITEELELNPVKDMQSTGKINDINSSHFSSSVSNVNEGTINNRDPSAAEPRVQNV